MGIRAGVVEGDVIDIVTQGDLEWEAVHAMQEDFKKMDRESTTSHEARASMSGFAVGAAKLEASAGLVHMVGRT